MPPAAVMPAWRMAPPICCLRRHASAMKSREPAMAAPTGAPSPLVKSIHAESKGAAHCWAEMPEGAAAEVRRLLDPGEAAPRHVTVVGTDGGLERCGVVLPARAVEGLDVDAGQRGGAAGFEMGGGRPLLL